MKLFSWAKDGGKDSHVDGFFVVEIKSLFSVVLLHFKPGTREAFHNHAFNALTWILAGHFEEIHLNGKTRIFKPSFKPKFTSHKTFHKVFSTSGTWALTFRGPWNDTWREYLPKSKQFVTLTHGRKVVNQ